MTTFRDDIVFRRWDGTGPDMLGDRPVVDGELLDVRWPDGTLTTEVAIIDDITGDGRSYFVVEHNGQRLRVHLHGLYASSVRRSPKPEPESPFDVALDAADARGVLPTQLVDVEKRT